MRCMRWIVVLIMLAACDCGETSPRVPFKLSPVTQPSAEGAAPETQELERSADHFDKPVDHPMIDGVASPFVATRFALAADLDADQDRDAIAIVNSAEEGVSLAFAMREAKGFGPATLVPGFGLSAGCEPTSLALSVLSTTKGVMSLESTCGEAKAAQPRKELLFALDAKPYLLEQVEISSAAEAQAPQLALTFTGQDMDADAHDDVLIEATLTPVAGSASISQRLVLLDRGPSLAFDAAGFEAALLARAEGAKSLLRKAPAEAAAEAHAVIALFNAVCRDSQRARVAIAGKQGLPCAPSSALARAYATWIATQASKDQLVTALDAYVALSQLEARAAKPALADATRALFALKPRAGITLSPGPSVSEATGLMVRLPSARFVTDNLLYVRRDAPVVYDIEHATEAAAPAAEDRVLDPAGTLAATAIERRCSGFFLHIERAANPNPALVSRPVSTPALLPLDPHCSDTPQTRRKNSGGYRVLGWAPQGVLAARGSEVRLVPLSIEGSASGEPRALDALMPWPAPLALGRATSDGSRYAWLTPFGVVIMDTSGKAELWRPKGWETIGPGASDVALSPSGRRIAVISVGRVYLLSSLPTPATSP